MAYSSGGLIQATDYNTLGNSLATVWGTGTGNKGYGQDTSSFANVATGNTVSAAQWTNLIGKTNSALAHQGQSTITPTSVTAGSNVTYYSSITSGIASVTGAASGQTGLSLSDGTASNATYSGTWGTTGNRGLKFTHTITFASGNAARYFFNAGGRLKLSFSRSGGSATTRNTEWTALATALGSIQMGALDWYKVGGSGTLANLQHDGYYGLTTSAVQKLLQYDNVGSYSNNYITTNASWSGTAQNGGYPVIVFETYWINAWVNAFQDAVDGSATTSLIVSSPSTTYLANSWGTPTVGTSAVLY